MISTNSLEVVKTLLKYAKEETFQRKLVCGQNSIIHLAARYGNVEVLKLLLPYVKGMEIEPYGLTGMTPIHFAATNGHFEAVKLLSNYTKNPNSPDNSGCTSIHYALSPYSTDDPYKVKRSRHLRKGHIEIVKFLASLSPNPNMPDDDGKTPLDLASIYDNGAIVLPYLIKDKLIST